MFLCDYSALGSQNTNGQSPFTMGDSKSGVTCVTWESQSGVKSKKVVCCGYQSDLVMKRKHGAMNQVESLQKHKSVASTESEFGGQHRSKDLEQTKSKNT